MPYPTEHAARVRSPGDFIEESFRSKEITTGIRIIIGKLKDGGDSMVTQAYRFAASKFSADEARKWLKDHDITYMSFEEATGEDKENKSSAMEGDPMYVKLDEAERRCLPRAELRLSGSGGSRKIQGYAAVFNVWANIGGWFRECVKPGAFKKTIKENDVRALLNHDPNYVLGRNASGTLKLREDSKGLEVEIDPVPTTWANDLMISMERGDVNQMSFGFSVNKQEVDYEKDERTLTDVTLYDVSVVTYPAYPTTSAQVRSMFQKKPESQDVSTPEVPIYVDDELECVFRKVRAKEKLSIEEFRLLAVHAPDLSVPPAKHTGTDPEPPAKHSATDTRKGTVAELLIRTSRITTTRKEDK